MKYNDFFQDGKSALEITLENSKTDKMASKCYNLLRIQSASMVSCIKYKCQIHKHTARPLKAT